MLGIPRSARAGVSAWITPTFRAKGHLRHRFSVDIPEARVLAGRHSFGGEGGRTTRPSPFQRIGSAQPIEGQRSAFPRASGERETRRGGRHRFSMGALAPIGVRASPFQRPRADQPAEREAFECGGGSVPPAGRRRARHRFSVRSRAAGPSGGWSAPFAMPPRSRPSSRRAPLPGCPDTRPPGSRGRRPGPCGWPPWPPL